MASPPARRRRNHCTVGLSLASQRPLRIRGATSNESGTPRRSSSAANSCAASRFSVRTPDKDTITVGMAPAHTRKVNGGRQRGEARRKSYGLFGCSQSAKDNPERRS